MQRTFLVFAFAAALVTVQVLLLVTIPMLPEQVASRFGGGGMAIGFMTRGVYQIFFTSFSLFMPLFMVAMLGLLPRAKSARINIPNKEYWLAPERRAETLGIFLDQALMLGILLSAFFAMLHLLMVEANRHQPPRMSYEYFLPALGIYLLAVGLWVFTLVRRFRRPDDSAARR